MKLRALCILVLASCWVGACSSSPSPGVGRDAAAADPSDGGASFDGAPPLDAAPLLDAAATEADAGRAPIDIPCPSPCAIRWRELAPFDVALDHHTTFVVEREDGPYLYVLGGIQTDPLGSIAGYNARLSAAPIREDGDLGAWQHVDFGYGIGFHAQAVDTNEAGTTNVMWIGGLAHPNDDPALDPLGNPYALLARFVSGSGPGIDAMHLRDGGDLAAFPINLPSTRLHASAAIRLRTDGSRRDVFLIGGTRGEDATATALRYEDVIEPGGWVEDAPLPAPRSHHGMVIHDGSLYVIGGFSGPVLEPIGEPSILRSIHDESGRITGWEEAGALEEPPWTASSFVEDGWLYVVGGGVHGSHHDASGTFVDRVRRAPFLPDGRLGAFTDVNPLPMARAHVHQTPVYEGRVYSIGGRTRDESGEMVSSDRVFVGTIEDVPPLADAGVPEPLADAGVPDGE